MITVSILMGGKTPVEAGVPFQLVSADGANVLASAVTDDDGELEFDVDPASVGAVSLRLDMSALAASSR